MKNSREGGKISSINIQCSGTHISWHELFLAGNQGIHQNFVPTMITYKFQIQNGRLKKDEFFNSANSQYFFTKISGIGYWIIRIN